MLWGIRHSPNLAYKVIIKYLISAKNILSKKEKPRKVETMQGYHLYSHQKNYTLCVILRNAILRFAFSLWRGLILFFAII